MNQKSSLRENLKFVSWMLTGNTPARLMGFAEFCEYVYDPLTKAKDLNLSEAERKAILESVEERCSSIPKRLTEGF
jgi:hypothetical protein